MTTTDEKTTTDEQGTEQRLQRALEAHSQHITALIKRQATKTHREQTRLGNMMAVLAIVVAVLSVLGVLFASPNEIWFPIIGGGCLFSVLAVGAVMFLTFAHQQKKFM